MIFNITSQMRRQVFSLVLAWIHVMAWTEAKYAVKYLSGVDENSKTNVHILDPYDNLEIFCHRAEEKRIFNMWKTVSVRLIVTSEDYRVFHGPDEANVVEQYKESTSFFQMFPWRNKRLYLSVYNSSCVGVHSEKSFSVVLEVNYIDFWKVTRLVCGVIVFLLAPHLCRNVVFYYSSGVSLGIIASLLIAVFMLKRLIPGRMGAVSFLVGGWALVIYCFQLIYSNLRAVLLEYQSYVVAYLVVVGMISFAVCYKYGQAEDERTQNLIKWTLQIIGLGLVFFSTEWREIAIVLIIGILLVYNVPKRWKSLAMSYWRRKFPPKIKLLTEDEYHQQSSVETKKALEELQKFCQSPKCQSWKLIGKMRTPVRFAEFVEGASHLTDDEVLDYELETSLIDDSDDDQDSDSSAEEINLGNGDARTIY